MAFQVEITPIAEAQIDRAYRWYRERNPEFADRWFRGLMNAIATLQEKPQRCVLAVEHEIFSEEVRQLLYGRAKNGLCVKLLLDRLSSLAKSKEQLSTSHVEPQLF